MEKIVAVLMTIFLGFTPLQAAQIPLFDEAGGARANGMGLAVTSISDEVDSLIWNPAGLAAISDRELLISHANYFGEGTMMMIGLAQSRIFGLTVGGAYLSADIGDIDMRDVSVNMLQSGRFSKSAVVVGAGSSLNDDLAVGVTGKLIRQAIQTESYQALSLDIGAKYSRPTFGVGIVVKDVVAQKFGPDTLAPSVTAGLYIQPMDHLLKIAGDIIVQKGAKSQVNVGFEVSPIYLFTFRGGIEDVQSFNLAKNLTLGTRLNLSSWTFDFAYRTHAELENFYRLSVIIGF